MSNLAEMHPEPNESRQTPRVRSFLQGEIVHSGGAMRSECVVRDISDTGARLQLSSAITLPEHFDLVIPQRNRREKARMMWRHGDELGITFVAQMQSSQPVAAAAPQDHRIADLEGQVAQLRQQLATMRAMVEHLVKDRA
jgi:hypothetical protein